MKLKVVFLLFAALSSAFGQVSNRTSATGSDDIVDSLIKSQIVEFKPNLRRDPFVVPTGNTNDLNNKGLLIDEITIKGRIVVRNRVFAIVLDPHQNVLEIPVGFKFLDGELTEITTNALVFSQWDLNSTNRSVQRTLTKVFMREEEK